MRRRGSRRAWRKLLRDREVFSLDLQETIALDFRPIARRRAGCRRGDRRRTAAARPVRTAGAGPDRRAAAAAPPGRRAAAGGALPQARLRSGGHAARSGSAGRRWPCWPRCRGGATRKELHDAVTATVRGHAQPVIQLEERVRARQPRCRGDQRARRRPMTLQEARARFERDCISATLHPPPRPGGRRRQGAWHSADESLSEGAPAERLAGAAFASEVTCIRNGHPVAEDDTVGGACLTPVAAPRKI